MVHIYYYTYNVCVYKCKYANKVKKCTCCFINFVVMLARMYVLKRHKNYTCIKQIYSFISKVDFMKIWSIIVFTQVLNTFFYTVIGTIENSPRKMPYLKYLPIKWYFLSLPQLDFNYFNFYNFKTRENKTD